MTGIKGLKKCDNYKEFLISLVGALLLIVCYSIQFVRSGYYYKPCLYMIAAVQYIVLILVFGEKAISTTLFITGLLILPCTRFDLPFSFFLVMCSSWARPRTKVWKTIVYAFSVIPMMIIYNDKFTHVIIHVSICTFMYIGEYIADKARRNKPKLDLTQDEIIIISQLCEGKEIKEISEFSQNTVYSKLKAARMRNGINANWELVARYKDSL